MPTPNFKLLLNALRLGQPQDPKAAVFVLAEAIASHGEALEELKRRLSVAQSHANLMEAKAVRLEHELDLVRQGQGPSSVFPPPSQRPGPPSAPPPASAHPSYHADLAGHGDLAARGEMSGLSAHAMTGAQMEASFDDDESSMHTVVVRQQEVLALRSPEAPFRIAQPGDDRRAPQASIPGAPWARNATPQSTYPMEDFTVDGPQFIDGDADFEGETYRDRGHPPEGQPRRAPRPTPAMQDGPSARKPTPGKG